MGNLCARRRAVVEPLLEQAADPAAGFGNNFSLNVVEVSCVNSGRDAGGSTRGAATSPPTRERQRREQEGESEPNRGGNSRGQAGNSAGSASGSASSPPTRERQRSEREEEPDDVFGLPLIGVDRVRNAKRIFGFDPSQTLNKPLVMAVYKVLAVQLHPDKIGPSGARKMQVLNAARDILQAQ
eukprot:Skav211914  [mRNA]  locus=scaffold1200:11784:12699:- [translate_table: standard]